MTVAAPFIGPEPRYVYRPARPYSAAELRAARARTADLSGPWDPEAEREPDEDEDAPPEPEPERVRKPRRPAPLGPPVTLPPVGDDWYARFMRTGDPMAPAQTGRERADG